MGRLDMSDDEVGGSLLLVRSRPSGQGCPRCPCKPSLRLTKGPPPPKVEANYKPLVALVFAIVLVVFGLWSSRKKPWRGGTGKKAVMKAFTFISIPFVLAEAATGVVSFLTGQLSIPPVVGVGTAVDLAILLVGIVVAVLRTVRNTPSEAEEAGATQKR